MPRSVFFSQAVRSEQNLYEDLVIESLKIFGQDVYYIPRTLVNRDDILNEDPASKFDDAYLIEAYLENVDGFEGQGDLFSKFGLEIRDEATFVISRRQWGTNLLKFEGMVMPGGVTFNGRQLFDDANEEILKLEEECRLNWEQPVDFYTG